MEKSVCRRTMMGISLLTAVTAGQPATVSSRGPWPDHALEVTRFIQSNFYNPATGLYASTLTNKSPAMMWDNGVMLSALLSAAQADRAYLPILNRFFGAMDAYWDAAATPPGYEPAPTKGHGHDKYYDDSAWMVIDFVHAYELTKDDRYLTRAEETMAFVLSGWDELAGGGIWWHEAHKDGSKNTCSNAPAAVACLLLAQHQPPDRAKASVATAQRIVEWTVKNLQAGDGLFNDKLIVATGKIEGPKFTYNTALMIRAFLGLHRATGEDRYLAAAVRAGAAADAFIDPKTGAYRDEFRFTHLLVEADLALYCQTHDPRLLARARANGRHAYDTWKRAAPAELIENAAIARMLWLLAEAR